MISARPSIAPQDILDVDAENLLYPQFLNPSILDFNYSEPDYFQNFILKLQEIVREKAPPEDEELIQQAYIYNVNQSPYTLELVASSFFNNQGYWIQPPSSSIKPWITDTVIAGPLDAFNASIAYKVVLGSKNMGYFNITFGQSGSSAYYDGIADTPDPLLSNLKLAVYRNTFSPVVYAYELYNFLIWPNTYTNNLLNAWMATDPSPGGYGGFLQKFQRCFSSLFSGYGCPIIDDFDENYNSVAWSVGETGAVYTDPLVSYQKAVEFYGLRGYEEINCSSLALGTPHIRLLCIDGNDFINGGCQRYYTPLGWYNYTIAMVAHQNNMFSFKLGKGPLLADSYHASLGGGCIYNGLDTDFVYGSQALCFVKASSEDQPAIMDTEQLSFDAFDSSLPLEPSTLDGWGVEL